MEQTFTAAQLFNRGDGNQWTLIYESVIVKMNGKVVMGVMLSCTGAVRLDHMVGLTSSPLSENAKRSIQCDTQHGVRP